MGQGNKERENSAREKKNGLICWAELPGHKAASPRTTVNNRVEGKMQKPSLLSQEERRVCWGAGLLFWRENRIEGSTEHEPGFQERHNTTHEGLMPLEAGARL